MRGDAIGYRLKMRGPRRSRRKTGHDGPLALAKRWQPVDRAFGGRPGRRWCASHAPDPMTANLAAADVAVQLYTSGTTGHPKGALLTHGALTASMRQGKLTGEDWCRWTDADRGLVAMPQFHIGGTGFTFQTLNAGGTAVILGRPRHRRDPGNGRARGHHQRCSRFPPCSARCSAHPLAATTDLSSLRSYALRRVADPA